MPKFRFVFTVDSDVRLMEKAADPPREFRFEFSPFELVVVRDIIDHVSGVPLHRGLDAQVEIDWNELDDAALAHSVASAETTLIMLSAAARAPTADAKFHLAYEITPGVEDRAFLQHLSANGVPVPRTPAPPEGLESVWTAVHRAASADLPLAQRVMLSMSWYRRALREAEELFRFNNLWLACEALNPRLCDAYGIPKDQRSGLPGLRRLLLEFLGGDETFTVAVAARNDLLHVNRVLPGELRQRVRPVINKLDDALIAGWRILLEIPRDVQFPPSSVRPFPYRYVVRGTLRPDTQGWSEDRHPYLEQTIELKAREPEHPGDIAFDQSPTWTLRNATEFSAASFGLSGSETPNPFKIEQTGDVRITRRDQSDAGENFQ